MIAIGVFDRRQRTSPTLVNPIVKNRVINTADYDSFEQSAGKHGKRKSPNRLAAGASWGEGGFDPLQKAP
jgi:hypothetical protein